MGEKPIKLLVERREREYLNTEGTVIGRGWEIKKEINVTLIGFGQWCAKHPEDQVASETYAKLLRAEEVRRRTQLKEGIKED